MYQFLKSKARKEYHYFPIFTNKDKAIRILFLSQHQTKKQQGMRNNQIHFQSFSRTTAKV